MQVVSVKVQVYARFFLGSGMDGYQRWFGSFEEKKIYIIPPEKGSNFLVLRVLYHIA